MPARKPAYVYVIATCDRGAFKTYVGWTPDLDARLAAHNEGKGAKATRGRRWTIIYAERCRSPRLAMSREWHLKRDRRFRRALAEPFKSGRATARSPRELRRRAEHPVELRSRPAHRAADHERRPVKARPQRAHRPRRQRHPP